MNTPDPIRILANSHSAPRIKAELTRRGFVAALGAFGTAGALAACAGPQSGGGEGSADGEMESTLAMYTWGDYDAPDVLTDFESENGVRLTVDSYGSNEELISKLSGARGTSGYDIVVPTGVYIGEMIAAGLLQKLDRAALPNMDHVAPEYLGQPWDPENEYSVCKAVGTNGYLYDTTKIDRELTTWDDFFDCAMNEASGRTSMLDDPQGIVGAYFWAKEYSTNDNNAAHFDEAEDFLVNQVASHISNFDSYPGSAAIPQSQQWLMQAWPNDARIGIMESSEPDKWKYVIGAPNSELWMDNWCIAEGANSPVAAHAFINFVLDPEIAFRQMEYVGADTGTSGLKERADEAGVEYPELIFFTPEQVATFRTVEITESQERFVDIWNKMKSRAAQ